MQNEKKHDFLVRGLSKKSRNALKRLAIKNKRSFSAEARFAIESYTDGIEMFKTAQEKSAKIFIDEAKPKK